MNQADGLNYDVAISFLGDDLGLAEELANLLRHRMSVFLFTERQGDVAGSDGLDKLSSVFENEARLAVVLYRPGWGETPWTRVEETAIKNRGLAQGWDFLLVIPLDAEPTVPRWVPKTQIRLWYARYGLTTAVAVLERKLEEVGGEAKPVTAESRAREHARRAKWQAERERLRRSQEGVDAAKAHVAALFAELERAVAASAPADIAFKRVNAGSARLWSQSPDWGQSPEARGTTVTFYWSQSWANVLDQSGLHVRLWRGFASAAGEGLIAFEKPRELEQHEFGFRVRRVRAVGVAAPHDGPHIRHRTARSLLHWPLTRPYQRWSVAVVQGAQVSPFGDNPSGKPTRAFRQGLAARIIALAFAWVRGSGGDRVGLGALDCDRPVRTQQEVASYYGDSDRPEGGGVCDRERGSPNEERQRTMDRCLGTRLRSGGRRSQSAVAGFRVGPVTGREVESGARAGECVPASLDSSGPPRVEGQEQAAGGLGERIATRRLVLSRL